MIKKRILLPIVCILLSIIANAQIQKGSANTISTNGCLSSYVTINGNQVNPLQGGIIPVNGGIIEIEITNTGSCSNTIGGVLDVSVGVSHSLGNLVNTIPNTLMPVVIDLVNSISNKNTYRVTIPINAIGKRRFYTYTFLDKHTSIKSGISVQIIQEANPDPTYGIFYLDEDNDNFGTKNTAQLFELTNVPDNYAGNDLDLCPNEAGGNQGCPDTLEDLNLNFVRSSAYDINGKLVSQSKSYFDDLGKQIQSQSYDLKNKKVWATETKYDTLRRPALQTMSAPIRSNSEANNFGYIDNFVRKNNGNTFTNSDFEGSDVLNPTTVGNQVNSLGYYYSTANTDEPLQDITNRPYSRTIYSELNPGAVKQIIGGNKINGTWKQGYSFTMPAAQEMYYTYGYNYFESNATIANTYENISDIIQDTNAHIVWLKATKTVVEDIKGYEAVVFTDNDGKTLGAAKSGGTKKYEVLSLIGEQGFIDIHIPDGCENTADFIGGFNQYKIYDLKTETIVTNSLLPSGFYRVEYIGGTTLTNAHNLTYIDKKVNNTVGKIKPILSDAVGIYYKVNYYDFSLNYYDDIGRLISSLQPLGFNNDCFNSLSSTVNHNEGLKSTFAYNTLGELVSTTSPDEGTANFKYRRDGQIRFSQNTKQAEVSPQEFSYTNYDELGRPIESGVGIGTFSGLNPNNDLPAGITKKEQHFTTYDFLSTTDLQYLNSLNGNYGNPSFLSSNVAKTSNENSTTYYSYDVYGRVQWIVQQIEGFTDAKTIDYEYDPVTSQVLQVIFQKENTAEKFIHKYTYHEDSQELLKVETSIDGTAYITHADYDYYETGALKRVELAEGIQGIDYVYNLAGQLKSINHPNLTDTNDPGGDSNDLFGLTLDYYSGDYQRDSRFVNTSDAEDQYNGNIKSMTWNTNTNDNVTSPFQYKYEYDRNNWLKSALFDGMGNQQNSAPNTIVLDTEILNRKFAEATESITLKPGFKITATNSIVFNAKIVTNTSNAIYGEGDYNVTNLTYDTNGNIKSLFRNKNTENGTNEMDKLTYEYKTDKPNQLLRVDDAVTNPTNADDIKDQNGNNYVYNSIGQLTTNVGEDVSYEYNASGLVTIVKYNGKKKVEFLYNDKNFRTKKISYQNNGVTPQKITDYFRDASGSVLAIYEDGAQKELPIYGANRLGVYNKTNATSVYQLADHLGNVRAVIAKQGNNAVALTSATDYYPFGMPMPNRQIVNGEPYRYAYQGQEKDPETGKEAFQLRLWDSRIGRWLTTDPASQYHSPYMGMGNSPMNGVDPDGAFFSRFGAWLYKTIRGIDGEIFENEKGNFGITGNDEDSTLYYGFDWEKENLFDNFFGSFWDNGNFVSFVSPESFHQPSDMIEIKDFVSDSKELIKPGHPEFKWKKPYEFDQYTMALGQQVIKARVTQLFPFGGFRGKLALGSAFFTEAYFNPGGVQSQFGAEYEKQTGHYKYGASISSYLGIKTSYHIYKTSEKITTYHFTGKVYERLVYGQSKSHLFTSPVRH